MSSIADERPPGDPGPAPEQGTGGGTTEHGAETPDGSSLGRLRQTVAAAGRRASDLRVDLVARWPQADLAFELADRYRRLNGAALAGHIAFRLFSWLLPLILAVVAMVGFADDTGVAIEEEADERLGLGRTMAQALRATATDTQSSRLHLGLAALSSLLLTTSGLLSALHLTHASLWDLPERRVRGRGRLLSRVLGGVPMVLAIVLASSALRQAGLVGGLAGTVLSTGVMFAILLGLAWILPRRATALADLVPGAAVGAGLFVGLQAFAAWYLPSRIARMSATYGVFGVTVTALLYLFLLGQIVVLSVLVNAVWFDHRPDRPAASVSGPTGGP